MVKPANRMDRTIAGLEAAVGQCEHRVLTQGIGFTRWDNSDRTALRTRTLVSVKRKSVTASDAISRYNAFQCCSLIRKQ